MSQDRLIKFKCSKCKNINYYTRKGKLHKEKLAVKKFCKTCKSHQEHKESK